MSWVPAQCGLFTVPRVELSRKVVHDRGPCAAARACQTLGPRGHRGQVRARPSCAWQPLRAPHGLSTCFTICPSKGRLRGMRVPAHLSSSAKIVQSDQLPSCADSVLPVCQVHRVHAYEQQSSPTSSVRGLRVTIVSVIARVPSLRGRCSARLDRRARHRPVCPPTPPSPAHPEPAISHSCCPLAHHSPLFAAMAQVTARRRRPTSRRASARAAAPSTGPCGSGPVPGSLAARLGGFALDGAARRPIVNNQGRNSGSVAVPPRSYAGIGRQVKRVL